MSANQELGLDTARVDISVGAIAIGDPTGASGARVLVTLLTAWSANRPTRDWLHSASAKARGSRWPWIEWSDADELENKTILMAGGRAASVPRSFGNPRMQVPDVVRKRIIARIPVAQLRRPAEITRTVAFLNTG